LAEHFVRKFALRQGKCIEQIPAHVMQALKLHCWPGNVRELQNVIERAVIMTTGTILGAPIALVTNPIAETIAPKTGRTLNDAQRAHILATLQEAAWVVGGRNGAAARLGLPRTTLIAKMKRLGIPGDKMPAAEGCLLSRAATANGADSSRAKEIQRMWPAGN
jgi:formate hydrogenlyase transcriptional activator